MRTSSVRVDEIEEVAVTWIFISAAIALIAISPATDVSFRN